jgi:hypothetical protein
MVPFFLSLFLLLFPLDSKKSLAWSAGSRAAGAMVLVGRKPGTGGICCLFNHHSAHFNCFSSLYFPNLSTIIVS